MGAYRAGNVALANAVGNGVADDKAIYAYVPTFIRYYLGEEPICGAWIRIFVRGREHLSFVLEHLPELVVKAVGESGGYGMLIGPAAEHWTDSRNFANGFRRIARNYIAQPVVPLSRVPSYDTERETVEGRHVDLRPYCLYDGEKVTIVPGGLTRRGAAARIAGGEFIAGRREQGHLGSLRGKIRMLSRIAESLFWLARYIERAEDTARLLDVNYHMILEQSHQPYRLRWDPLIVMAGEEHRFRQLYSEANADNVLNFWLSPGQSQFDRAVRGEGAGECANDSRPDFAGDVGRHQWIVFRGEPV